jgi:hypothetical protein
MSNASGCELPGSLSVETRTVLLRTLAGVARFDGLVSEVCGSRQDRRRRIWLECQTTPPQ